VSRLVFYNAGPPSTTRPGDAAADLGGLLREYRPRVLIACEVVGDQLQQVPGWRMVRSRRTAGRANLVAYVREDCHHRKTWWIDHRTTWSRTNPGAVGKHPPRSSLVLSIGEAQVLGAHNAPMGTDNTHAAQLEIVQALHVVMAPWQRPRLRDTAPELSLEAMRARPRVLLWDDNDPPGSEGLGSEYLAPKVGGKAWGLPVDRAVARKAGVEAAEYVTHAGGRKLATDHRRGALVLHLERGAIAWS
jgi:hypothetical protein